MGLMTRWTGAVPAVAAMLATAMLVPGAAPAQAEIISGAYHIEATGLTGPLPTFTADFFITFDNTKFYSFADQTPATLISSPPFATPESPCFLFLHPK